MSSSPPCVTVSPGPTTNPVPPIPPRRRSPISPRSGASRWLGSALEIAAAGAHHTLFLGPPGSGKTMLAARLPGILPPLDRVQALEATMVHSAAGAPLPPSGLHRAATVPCAASHEFAGRHHRRRIAGGSPGRSEPCAPRRAVPRRDRRVSGGGPRLAPPTARGWHRPAPPVAAPRSDAGALPAHRGDEPVPVRRRGRARRLRVWRRGAPALHPAALRAGTRPLRSARQRAPPGDRRHHGERTPGVLERRGRPRARRAAHGTRAPSVPQPSDRTSATSIGSHRSSRQPGPGCATRWNAAG